MEPCRKVEEEELPLINHHDSAQRLVNEPRRGIESCTGSLELLQQCYMICLAETVLFCSPIKSLCHQFHHPPGLLDLPLGLSAEKARLHHQRYLRDPSLAQHL